MEAFALGKAVIGARIGGIPELVRDNETGWTFESGNVEVLKEKIHLLLSTNQEKIFKMGQNARNLVEKIHNPDIHYEQLMKIYRSAAEKTKQTI